DGPINRDAARLWPELCQSGHIYRPNGITGSCQQSALAVERSGEIQHCGRAQGPIPGNPHSVALIVCIRILSPDELELIDLLCREVVAKHDRIPRPQLLTDLTV